MEQLILDILKTFRKLNEPQYILVCDIGSEEVIHKNIEDHGMKNLVKVVGQPYVEYGKAYLFQGDMGMPIKPSLWEGE